MTTVYHAAIAEPDRDQEDPEREPTWRVVGGSLAVGFVGALILTLVVFAGAPEPVISGTALLAFACGWALLALSSARFTSQPQSWARVPAVAMATIGILLLVARPSDGTLNAAGWVWPATTLALTGWMVVQLRRSLHGRVRWLLYPIMAALIFGSVGGTLETVARARALDDYPAPGELYDVGGHRLHLDCVGSGSPTVVLQNGLGGVSVLWSRITEPVARTTRVCAYDRAGQGWSDDVDAPQDGEEIAEDLHTLLERAGETSPFVLVGHSAGGVYSMIYADRYPDEVAGMVLLDSMTPYQFTALPDFGSEYSMMRRGLAVLPSIARLGVARALPAAAFSSVPEPAASQVRAFAADPRQFRNMRDEHSVYRAVLEQAKALISLDNKPLVVITASEQQRKSNGWGEAQARLAELSTDSERRVVETTHEGVIDDEQGSEPSAQAIADVVYSVRTGAPIVPR